MESNFRKSKVLSGLLTGAACYVALRIDFLTCGVTLPRSSADFVVEAIAIVIFMFFGALFRWVTGTIESSNARFNPVRNAEAISPNNDSLVGAYGDVGFRIRDKYGFDADVSKL